MSAEIGDKIRKLNELKGRFDPYLKELNRYPELATQTEHLWNRFTDLFPVLAVQHGYRPDPRRLDRFDLQKDQEWLVAHNYEGAYRIQGASGSGKTIILIYRALRLSQEHPGKETRVFTINRTLATLLRSIVMAMNARIPSNLHIGAFYDFMLECVGKFESLDEYRLADELSGERIAVTAQ